MRTLERITYLVMLFLAAVLFTCTSCTKEIADEPENVQFMTLKIDNVREGDDVPVTITFNKAGLNVDNDGWGDPWKNAVFHAVVKDSFGRVVENTLWSGPNGILSSGARIDMPENGVMNFVLGGLRQGHYTVEINMETRYTVDTWASGEVTILEATEPVNFVYVDDFTVPGKDDGAEIDENGNLVLDLRYFNDSRPFIYQSVISPANATIKKLQAESADGSIVSAIVRNSRYILLTPKKVGLCKVTVSSVDGNVTKNINVRVIETPPDAEGFTLPTDDPDDGGDAGAEFDVAGRLALDINNYPSGRYYEYVCKPIPSNATPPTLSAYSESPDVADANIVDGHILHIYPKSVGYANIIVSKSDGSARRVLKVAVITRGQIVLNVDEGVPSETDQESGVFPCVITFSSTTNYNPPALTMDAYTKVAFRADITDPADHFVADELKNSKSAYAQFEENVQVAFIPGVTAYDLYERLMLKVAGTKYLVHHNADWPNYKDYYLYARLYKITLHFNLIQNYDTNLYRFEIVSAYDNPENRIYQYL